ncbi:MAG: ATP-binding protein [Oligoflexia bacterium]|nr:ATP-binding protein [Oligoflexia bacterium]
MFDRMLNYSKSRSFFLFGPRGTGKTTFLKQEFSDKHGLWIDLLTYDQYLDFQKNPSLLAHRLKAIRPEDGKNWVIIDEVQKIPELLDVVHQQIEEKKFNFVLTGSSARKLKRGAANLLAGRAFQNYMHPLTYREIGAGFDVNFVLNWGTLPDVFNVNDADRKEYLRTYVNTYLREEIQVEQIVRKLAPFRSFLEIAAQSSGDIINYSRIANDINSDATSVKSYFEILEDTMIGAFLPGFHYSVRKRQRKNPKFYIFDMGVKKALRGDLSIEYVSSTFEYGIAFEHFIVNEIFRLNSYYKLDWRFYYLRTKDGVEVDLIIERPGMPIVLIEIKSTDRIAEAMTTSLAVMAKDIKNSEAYIFSQDPVAKIINNVKCVHWQTGFTEIGL